MIIAIIINIVKRTNLDMVDCVEESKHFYCTVLKQLG